MNHFKAAGVQIDPAGGITSKQLNELMFLVDDDDYEIISFDANNAVCYFIFSFSYFEKSIDGENLDKFKKMFIEIANDMRLETLDNIYCFEGENIYFGY